VTWDDPGPSLAAAAEMSGLEYIRVIFDSRLLPPPIAVAMGFVGAEAGEGKAVFIGEPGDFSTTRSESPTAGSR
jgi:hypothetical protein